MNGQMILRIWDVEHGACATLAHRHATGAGRLAMIDSGHNSSSGWRPSRHIKHDLYRRRLDHLIVTNADQDHLSDLEGLWQEGVEVAVLHRNPQPPAEILRGIKRQRGELTNDIERFLSIHGSYISPVSEPFDEHMGGITMTSFHNSYPMFSDTNNLSLVVFVKYAGFKVLFPGDMERDGWLSLLQQDAFRAELAGTNILVASHHGRSNGFCAEIFDYFTPDAVVISDKPIAHETQLTAPDYREVVGDSGVAVATTSKRRHVLTTRRDGHITFVVDEQSYRIETEYMG